MLAYFVHTRFVKKDPLVCHGFVWNTDMDFDLEFMNADLARIGKPKLGNECMNTMRMAKVALADTMVNGRSVMWDGQRKFISLQEMAAVLGVEDARERHEALADAMITAECYIKMRSKLDSIGSTEPQKKRARFIPVVSKPSTTDSK